MIYHKSNQKACLNRMFVNFQWLSFYPDTSTLCLVKKISYHTPICFDTGALYTPKKPIFRFEKYWLSQEGFIELVQDWYRQFVLGPDKACDWPLKIKILKSKLRG